MTHHKKLTLVDIIERICGAFVAMVGIIQIYITAKKEKIVKEKQQ